MKNLFKIWVLSLMSLVWLGTAAAQSGISQTAAKHDLRSNTGQMLATSVQEHAQTTALEAFQAQNVVKVERERDLR